MANNKDANIPCSLALLVTVTSPSAGTKPAPGANDAWVEGRATSEKEENPA
jgi:hypothetical protein